VKALVRNPWTNRTGDPDAVLILASRDVRDRGPGVVIVLCGLPLLEQRGMIPFFHPEDGVQAMRVQGLDMWGM